VSESPELGRVYREDAERYDRLVSREDHAGNLLPALRRIAPLEGRTIVDLGAGTGRLTRLLAPPAGRIVGLDLSPAMLRVARDRLARARGAPWALAVADHRALPIAGASADVVAAGWTVCYTVLWTGEAWREHLDRALGEMARIARPGGVQIIIETLGTGRETPEAPEPMRGYYGALEAAGFASTWVRTDYRFSSAAEAEELIGFFFGPELAARVAGEGMLVVPECTGIWWRHSASAT
jgi:ubiquinone/menaquinone biosynthesis C-methylase UbiE